MELDVNRLYLHHARRLAKSVDGSNVHFRLYDGRTLPTFESPFDTAFSIGVFERINRDHTASYVRQLAKMVASDGTLLLYFLSPRARQTTFVRRLGESAYVYWERGSVEDVARSAGLSIERVTPWGPWPVDGTSAKAPITVADLYVMKHMT
jgi:cyclopropane fatty-acyl-phospholipid synthase-like methyltransferase